MSASIGLKIRRGRGSVTEIGVSAAPSDPEFMLMLHTSGGCDENVQ